MFVILYYFCEKLQSHLVGSIKLWRSKGGKQVGVAEDFFLSRVRQRKFAKFAPSLCKSYPRLMQISYELCTKKLPSNVLGFNDISSYSLIVVEGFAAR
jgi:hypothetical protein